jgi:small subunit ribosomal protein S16
MPNQLGIKEIRLKSDRLKYWISVGAQPSDRVQWILGKFGLLPPPPPKYSPERMIPKKDREDVKKK